MNKLTEVTKQIMDERFGCDKLIALATCANNVPYVRNVNAYYENSAFYVLTYALSNKMQHMAQNPAVSIAGEWFTAQGRGESLGWCGSAQNAEMLGKLQAAFAEWIDNGHTDLSDENTVILRIALTEGVLFSHGTRYDIDFTE